MGVLERWSPVLPPPHHRWKLRGEMSQKTFPKPRSTDACLPHQMVRLQPGLKAPPDSQTHRQSPGQEAKRKHAHINKPVGGRSAGEGAWERRQRPHCQATRAGSHQGRRMVAGPSDQRPIWHLEDVTCPDGSRGGEEGGQGDFIPR